MAEKTGFWQSRQLAFAFYAFLIRLNTATLNLAAQISKLISLAKQRQRKSNFSKSLLSNSFSLPKARFV